MTTMPDPLELDRPLRGLRVVDTTDDTVVEQRPSARRSRCRRDPRRRARPQRRRARRDPQRQQALRRPRRGRGARALLGHADIWFETGNTSLDVADVRPRGAPAARGRLDQPVRSHRSVLRVRGHARGRLRAVAASCPLCRLPGRPPLLPPGQLAFEVAAAMAAYVALVAVWNRAVIGMRRPSRPLDPGGDDPDHRHAGRGRERAALRAGPADHQRGVHRRRRASRVPHRRRVGAPARGELPAMGGAPRVGR